MKRIKYIFTFTALTCFISFLTTQGLMARDPDFKASAPSTVTVGRAFNYTISTNENIRASVQFPDVEGIRMVGGPSTYSSTQSTFSGGKMVSVTTLTFTYNLIATREGTFTLPPATINAGNKVYSTNSVVITAVADPSGQAQTQSPPGGNQVPAASTSENYYIKLIPSKRSVYLGEQFVIEAKIFTNERLSFSEIKYPEFEGFWKHEIEAEQQATREMLDGREYLTQVFKRDLLLPQKTGSIKIDPLDVTVLVQKRVRSQRRSIFGDIFDDPFFDSYENVPTILKSNALNIEVKPLPAGAPSAFDGAVGQFTFDLSVDRNQTNVNDAITLKLTFKGKGNLSLLKAPQIPFPPDVEAFEPKTARNVVHTAVGSSGSVSFEYVIIPRNPGKFRIAPIEYAFFDPVKQSYQQLKTNELHFDVSAGDGKDQASISGGQPLMQGIMQERVNNLNTDILYIKTHSDNLLNPAIDIAGTLLFKLSIPAGILMYILLVVLYRKKIRQNRDIAYTRNKKARRKAEKRLRAARKFLGQNNKLMYEEILKVLWDYLSDKLNVPRSELSRESIGQGLSKYDLPQGLSDKLWDVIDECEIAGYATGASSEPEVIYSKSEDLLYQFEQILK